MSGDIVDAIDHALDDYALSMDAMRWVPDVVPDVSAFPVRFRPDVAVTALTPEQITQLAADVSRFWQQLADAVRPAIIAAGDAINRAASELVGIVVFPDPLPSDPRERALHLRRTRNVGPDGRTPAGRKRRT